MVMGIWIMQMAIASKDIENEINLMEKGLQFQHQENFMKEKSNLGRDMD